MDDARGSGRTNLVAALVAPIPRHHVRMTRLLNIAAGLAVLILAIGLWRLDLGLTLAGLFTAMGAKLWFLDRMVWLKIDTAAAETVK